MCACLIFERVCLVCCLAVAAAVCLSYRHSTPLARSLARHHHMVALYSHRTTNRGEREQAHFTITHNHTHTSALHTAAGGLKVGKRRRNKKRGQRASYVAFLSLRKRKSRWSFAPALPCPALPCSVFNKKNNVTLSADDYTPLSPSASQ